uniref:50S ribosomal protein L15 n=1 Tax=Panagrellus redivivus TaxID=6233 RepID=A0A7E4V342_PANRE
MVLHAIPWRERKSLVNLAGSKGKRQKVRSQKHKGYESGRKTCGRSVRRPPGAFASRNRGSLCAHDTLDRLRSLFDAMRVVIAIASRTEERVRVD